MPARSRMKCYFGCPTDDPVHRFPNPQSIQVEVLERFNSWKDILPQSTKEKGDIYIYNNIRLCSKHFKEKYILPTGRLTRNAVPTLNTDVNTQNVLEEFNLQPSTSMQPSTSLQPSTSRQASTSLQPSSSLQPSLPTHEPMSTETTQVHADVNTQNVLEEFNLQPSTPMQPSTSLQLSTSRQPSTSLQPSSSLQPSLPTHEPMSTETTQVHAEKRHVDAATSSARAQRTRATTNYVKPLKHPVTRAHQSKQRQPLLKARLQLRAVQKKLEKITSKYKTQKKKIQMAKRLSLNKSFLKNIENFPDDIQTFISMQLNYKKKPKGRRFTLKEKVTALTILKQSPKGFNVLRSRIVMPSKRCLQKLLSKFVMRPGINKKLFKNIDDIVKNAKKFKRTENKLVTLIFDEVAICPGVYYKKNGIIVGFEDTGEKRNRTLADHALVFMIKGIKKKYKQPICFTFCKNTTKADDLKNLVIKLIKELDTIGLTVVSTICDQSSTNVKVINALLNETKEKYLKNGEDYNSTFFEVNNNKIFPLFDTPHLLKGVRNNLLSKDASFEQDGKTKCAKWEHLQMLLDLDVGEDEIRLVNKLTATHVHKDMIPKMKVQHAAEVFSQRVSSALRFLARHNLLPSECADTADFLLLFDQLFDSFNGHLYSESKKMYKSCLKTNSPHFQLWTNVLPILESIKFKSVIKRHNTIVIKNESVPSVKNWIHNIKTIIDLYDYLNQKFNVITLLTRNFNQDPLEKFFSSIRSNGIRNTNPTCDQFTNAFKTLLINNLNSLHSEAANCEKDDNKSIGPMMNLLKDVEKSDVDSQIADFTCDIDYLLILMNTIRSNSDFLHQESKKYVTGYVIKKCKSKIFRGCIICMRDLCRSEIDTQSFIYEVDYTKKSLYHPNQKLIDLMNDIYYVIVACLRESPESLHLTAKIRFSINCACQFDFITCEKHKKKLIDLIIELSINVIVHSWCTGVNRILKGKITKFDESDLIKKQALEYYNKRLKR